MDLLALYKNPVFNFQRVVHEALRAYVRGQQYFVFVPKCDKDLSDFDFKYIYQFTITLDEDADADVIKWLESAQPKLQNALIKSVLRGSLVGQSVFACLSEDTDRIKSNMLAEQALTCGVKILPPPTGKHTKNGKTSKPHRIKNQIASQTPAKIMSKSEMTAKHIRPQKQASVSDFISNTKNAAQPEQPEPVPNVVTTLQKNTVTNIPDANDFDLTGFNFDDESAEKSVTDDFDLFGDISNMLKGF